MSEWTDFLRRLEMERRAPPWPRPEDVLPVKQHEMDPGTLSQARMMLDALKDQETPRAIQQRRDELLQEGEDENP